MTFTKAEVWWNTDKFTVYMASKAIFEKGFQLGLKIPQNSKGSCFDIGKWVTYLQLAGFLRRKSTWWSQSPKCLTTYTFWLVQRLAWLSLTHENCRWTQMPPMTKHVYSNKEILFNFESVDLLWAELVQGKLYRMCCFTKGCRESRQTKSHANFTRFEWDIQHSEN